MARSKRGTPPKKSAAQRTSRKTAAKAATRPAGNRRTTPIEPTPAKPLAAANLRWRCDPDRIPADSTTEVEAAVGVLGQDDAIAALRFGLETSAPGQNIYVRGLSGTGRLTLVRRLLEDIQLMCPLTKDVCYVHNFGQPDRPRLITLPAGQGSKFRRQVRHVIDFIRDDFAGALKSDTLKSRQQSIERAAENEVNKITQPFEQALAEAGLTLVRIEAGPVTQTAIYPVIDGKPVPPEEYDQLRAQGQVSEEDFSRTREKFQEFEKELADVGDAVNNVHRRLNENLRTMYERSARWIMTEAVREIRDAYTESSIQTFLSELIDDLVQHRLGALEQDTDFLDLYDVNVIAEHSGDGVCPIVVESNPTARNLVGTVDFHFTDGGDEARVSHMGIRPGALLRADGGYLVLEVRDVLEEPHAWKILTRTLRNRRLEIGASDAGLPWVNMGPSLKPESIDINVKVILLGDSEMYYLLDEMDPDFSQLFKVLADFDPLMPRNDDAIRCYAAILARIAGEDQLPPFDRTAIAAWIEHGARIAARRDRLSARFGRLADLAREAAFLATADDRQRVTGDDVRNAIRRTKRRADLPARRFREYVADGTIHIDTQGAVVGQVNGLAVLQAGPLTYGFPSRISATIGPGNAGVINIEREAALSGAIHTKGFYILGGLLRHLLRTDHPLVFDASVAFEQSYGGIDGDSASGAEICCLLSALTSIPLRQDLAMTGAIDQVGHVLAIGAVNEKIEGFYDACRDLGLTGTQGVIIPRANTGDLMLREDVVADCAAGRFHVFAVDRIEEALTLFTGKPAGKRGRNGKYPAESVLGIAVARAREYWQKVASAGRKQS